MRFARSFAKNCRERRPISRDVYRRFHRFRPALYRPATFIPASWAGCMAAALAVGMLAEMLAAGLNANLGGRDHMPIEVERQIVEWTRRDVRLSRRRERHLRHRHVDGQSDGGAGGADLRARQAVRRQGIGGEGRVADGLHVEGGAWLHRQGRWISRVSAATRCARSPSTNPIASTSQRCGRRSRATARPD